MFCIKSAHQKIYKQFSGPIHITDSQYFCLTSRTCALSYTISSLAAGYILRLHLTCKFLPGLLFIATFCCHLAYYTSCVGVLLLPAVSWTVLNWTHTFGSSPLYRCISIILFDNRETSAKDYVNLLYKKVRCSIFLILLMKWIMC